MPRNPFKGAARPRVPRPAASRPAKPGYKSTAPSPVVPNGRSSRRSAMPKQPAAVVTTKGEKNVRMPPVRQGTKLGA